MEALPGSHVPSDALALNFRPVVRSAVVRDERAQLTVLTQQPGAVTSSQRGEMQLMVHRRSLQDDSKVGGPLLRACVQGVPLSVGR